jgi:molecular chaperone GrpE
LRAQLADVSDKYMRAMAELENTRRRAALDAESGARARAMLVAENFLPLVDAVDAAAVHAPEDSGIKAMAAAMRGALAKVGMTRIDTAGAALNPSLHNAVSVEGKDGAAPNAIVRELQAGYMFGDTVLRPAMVVVAA